MSSRRGRPLVHHRTSSLGAAIERARLRAGLTQLDLAAALGVGPRTVQRWEAGTCEPRAGHVATVARVCGVAVKMLLGG